MTEAYLHYLFNSKKLGNSFQTTNNEEIEVLEFGQLNKSSGPDFIEAIIKFDSKIWAGHIEFHLKSSDWNRHGHQHDAAYENVIAHFVLEHDQEVVINKFRLPVVELRSKINTQDFHQYQKLIRSKNWVPCEKSLNDVAPSIVDSQLQTALQNRMQRKQKEANLLFTNLNYDTKLLVCKLMAASLGGKHNKQAMEVLFEKINWDYLEKVNYEYVAADNYLFNLSGLGDSVTNAMSKTHWKTFGMHPPAQPKNRIKLFALLLSEIYKTTLPNSFTTWQHFLNNIETNGKKALSKNLQHQLLINCVLPILSTQENDTLSSTEVSLMLSKLPAEANSTVKKWKSLGVTAENAQHSQALIELKNEYCSKKKCLFCSIGKSLLAQ